MPLVRLAKTWRPPTLEVGFSARSAGEARTGLRNPTLGHMPVEYLTPVIEDRAVEVWWGLAGQGRHRAPNIPDLLIAATAELAGLTVLHVDTDFDLIAVSPASRSNGSASDAARTLPSLLLTSSDLSSATVPVRTRTRY